MLIVGDNVYIRRVLWGDAKSYIELRSLSRDFLEPFEPTWSSLELTKRGFWKRWRYSQKGWKRGTHYMFLIFSKRTHDLLGGINVNGVRYGVAQSAHIGYWIGLPFTGCGYMTEAVGLCLRFCFGTLRLNRVEASCLLHNMASQKVLQKNNFEQEGMAKRYLKINGVFQDHLLFGRVRD